MMCLDKKKTSDFFLLITYYVYNNCIAFVSKPFCILVWPTRLFTSMVCDTDSTLLKSY